MSLNAISVTAPSARVAHAGQFTLMWWRFRRHRAAVAGGVIVVLIYVVAVFAEFLATTTPDMSRPDYTYAPPQRLHLFDETWSFGPHVYGYKVAIDPVALRRIFVLDPGDKIPVRLFAKGEPYHLWGLIPAERHLLSTADPSRPFYLLGADRLGRDVYSRLLAGTRISMSVGLVGVSLSLFLGVLLGGISGYYGGRTDDVILAASAIPADFMLERALAVARSHATSRPSDSRRARRRRSSISALVPIGDPCLIFRPSLQTRP